MKTEELSAQKSSNPPEPEIDKRWAEVARRRLDEIRSGAIKPVSGEEIFEEIWKRFS